MPIAIRSKIITTTAAIPAPIPPVPTTPPAPNAILNPPFILDIIYAFYIILLHLFPFTLALLHSSIAAFLQKLPCEQAAASAVPWRNS